MVLVVTALIIVLVALVSACSVPVTTTPPQTSDVFCSFALTLHQDVHWTPLRPGDQLSHSDSILTCQSTRVTLRANADLWIKPNGLPNGKGDVNTIGQNRLIPLQGTLPNAWTSGLQVEVAELVGRAFYSKDLTKKYGVIEATGSVSLANDIETLEVYSDIAAMDWEPLTVSRILHPWDMLWTRDGRVEIEILRDGPTSLIDEAIAVVGPDGQFTKKRRLLERTFFIMYPQFYAKARVNRIVGTVSVARDPEQTRSFFERHQVITGILKFMDQETQRANREMLKKKELD